MLNVLSVHHSELELRLQASFASTHNGAFLWRIPEVRRRIRDAESLAFTLRHFTLEEMATRCASELISMVMVVENERISPSSLS